MREVPWWFVPTLKERRAIKQFGSCWRNCLRVTGNVHQLKHRLGISF